MKSNKNNNDSTASLYKSIDSNRLDSFKDSLMYPTSNGILDGFGLDNPEISKILF